MILSKKLLIVALIIDIIKLLKNPEELETCEAISSFQVILSSGSFRLIKSKPAVRCTFPYTFLAKMNRLCIFRESDFTTRRLIL